MRLFKVFALGLIVYIGLSIPMAVYFPDTLESISREDRLLECLTALMFLAAFAVGAVYLPIGNGKRGKVLPACIAAIGLIGFLDEVSFGRGHGIPYSMFHVCGIPVDGLHDVVAIGWHLAHDHLSMSVAGFAALLSAVLAIGAAWLLLTVKPRSRAIVAEPAVSLPYALGFSCLLLMGAALFLDLELIALGRFGMFAEESMELFAGVALLLCGMEVSSEAVRLRLEHGTMRDPAVVCRKPIRRAIWIRFLPAALGVLFLAGVASILHALYFKEPHRLRNYWATKRVILSLPREGALLTSPSLEALCPSWKRVVTFEKYDPGAHDVDMILGAVSSLRKADRSIVLHAIDGKGFSDRYFDGDLFLLSRNETGPVAPMLRRLCNGETMVPLSRTCHHGGETHYVKPGGCVWHWKGNTRGGPLTLSFGIHRRLEPGRYTAVLSYRGEEPDAPSGQPWGFFGVYAKGAREPIREAELAKQTPPHGEFAIQEIEFELTEATDVEPRVGGIHAELWLRHVFFERLQE